MITKLEFKRKLKRKLKICILGNTGSDPVNAYSWFVRTTADGMKRNGHEVVGLDWKSNTTKYIMTFLDMYKPDVLFTHMTFHAHHPVQQMLEFFKDLRKKYGTVMIHTLQDARSMPRYNNDLSESFDLALVGQTKNLEKFSNIWKIKTFYWPYSSMYQEKMAELNPDFYFDAPLFTGSPGIHFDRKEFIRALQEAMPIYMIKTKGQNDLRDHTAELSATTSCILGLCTGYSIDGYIDVRPFQYLGAGAFMISRKFKGQEKLIPDDLYVPFYNYDDPEVVRDLFIEWENKSDEKKKMKERAFKYMQKYNNNIIRNKQALDYVMEAI